MPDDSNRSPVEPNLLAGEDVAITDAAPARFKKADDLAANSPLANRRPKTGEYSIRAARLDAVRFPQHPANYGRCAG
jgi:hypothetical protein